MNPRTYATPIAAVIGLPAFTLPAYTRCDHSKYHKMGRGLMIGTRKHAGRSLLNEQVLDCELAVPQPTGRTRLRTALPL